VAPTSRLPAEAQDQSVIKNTSSYLNKEVTLPDAVITIRRPLPEELLDIRVMRRQELLGEMVDSATLKIDPLDLERKVVHIVAFKSDGDVVSCVRLRPIAEDQTVYEVSRMVTRKRFRGQGIGARVLAAAEQQAVQDGAKAFVLDSRKDAQNFYKRAGYWTTGRQKILENGDVNYIIVKQVNNAN
jgi:predicted GNAT family N-acyltransferase